MRVSKPGRGEYVAEGGEGDEASDGVKEGVEQTDMEGSACSDLALYYEACM